MSILPPRSSGDKQTRTRPPELGRFLREEVYPRLTAEAVYTDPAHAWHKSGSKWRGGCPWHDSKSGTAFVVSTDSLLWFCAGCNVGGGPLEYRWRLGGGQGPPPRGAQFVAGVRALAELAGVPFPERELTAAEQEAARRQEVRSAALLTVAAYCQERLWAGEQEAARAYLHERGFSDEDLRDLEVGYYPDAGAVGAHLRGCGYADGDVRDAGVAFPRMAGYVVFPWKDERGHALTLYGTWPGRTPPAGKPKKMALPGQGSKRSPLYLDRARQAGHDTLVLVEGLTDAALAQRRGDTRVISPVANKLSAEQAQTLRRCGVRRVIICLDPDGGGKAGTPSCIGMLAGVGITAYVAPWLPDELDPDDFIVRDGIDAWKTHLEGAEHAFRYFAGDILRKHRGAGGWTDPGKDAAISDAIALAAAQPPERDAELARHFWPVVIKATRARLTDLRPQVQAARQADSDRKRGRLHESNGHSQGSHSPGTQPPGSPGSPYTIDEQGRICRHARGPGGEEYTQPLCNFSARIVRDVIVDDGSGEERHTFTIEGALYDKTPLPAITISASDFGSMNWPVRGWGLGAVVFAGQGTREHLRVALQELSAEAERQRIYEHTGWRQYQGGWCYLHGRGATSAAGTLPAIRVELRGKLSNYRLPDPPAGAALAKAIGSDLRLLDAAVPRLMYPLLGAVYRAALGVADCSLALIGQTGLGKSELASLAQQHFGADLHRLNLPGNWSSSANALEALAFLAKDALLVIDDFKPGGSKSEIDQLHAKADRVLRAQGNNSARQRCWADGSVRADRPPRGLIIMTGEDQVRGESLRARQLPLLVRKGDLDVRSLTPFQQDAAAGVYAQVLSAFLQWLAPQYDTVHSRLPREYAALRDQAIGAENHPRTPGIVADLALGLKYFLDFGVAAGVIKPRGRDRLADAGWQALLEAAADQAQEILAHDPTRRFLELVSGVVTSGQGHLASRDGTAPTNEASWGWRKVTLGTGQFVRTDWQPQGRLVGWIDDAGVYLHPGVSYAEAQRLADEQGERLPLSQQQLYRRLKDQKHLAATEEGKTTIRRTLQGRERAVLHLPPGALSPSQK
jgi:DNA primase